MISKTIVDQATGTYYQPRYSGGARGHVADWIVGVQGIATTLHYATEGQASLAANELASRISQLAGKPISPALGRAVRAIMQGLQPETMRQVFQDPGVAAETDRGYSNKQPDPAALSGSGLIDAVKANPGKSVAIGGLALVALVAFVILLLSSSSSRGRSV